MSEPFIIGSVIRKNETLKEFRNVLVMEAAAFSLSVIETVEKKGWI